MIVEQLSFTGLDTQVQIKEALRKIEMASKQQLVYVQTADPGPVGPRRLWITPSGTLSVRALDNLSWITVI